MYRYQFGPLLHTERISTDDSPAAALLRAVEAADVDVEPDSADALYNYVDPGALDRLFHGPHSARDSGFVVLELWDVAVQMSRHEVAVYDSLAVESPPASDTTTE